MCRCLVRDTKKKALTMAKQIGMPSDFRPIGATELLQTFRIISKKGEFTVYRFYIIYITDDRSSFFTILTIHTFVLLLIGSVRFIVKGTTLS